MSILTPAILQYQIAKGTFDPNIRLSNMSLAYFQSLTDRPAKVLAPTLPVQLSNASYYKFNKGDLLRDDVRRKPQFGRVDPAIISRDTGVYNCEVDQIIMGIDQIEQVNFKRTNAPGVIQAQNALSKSIAQKMAIHQDVLFAQAYFKSGVWTEERTGVDATPSANQFIKFTNANSDPIKLIRNVILDIQRNTGFKPNKLGLGAETFNGLINHPSFLERVTGQGSTANPADVNAAVIASLVGVNKVAVLDSIYNKAELAQDDDMDFVCDPKGMLLVYAPDAPRLEEPSAMYNFTWDMLGDGNYLPIRMGLGDFGTHSELMEGMMATDMRIVAQDLAVYFKECV